MSLIFDLKDVNTANLINQEIAACSSAGMSFAAFQLPGSKSISLLAGKETIFSGELETSAPGFIFTEFKTDKGSRIIQAEYLLDIDLEKQTATSPNGILCSDKNSNNQFELPLISENFLSTKKDFLKITNKAISKIKTGDFKKVVLSRKKPLKTKEINPGKIFTALSSLFPNSLKTLIYSENFGLWVGASPETLVSLNENKVFKTVALAGTQRLYEDQDISEAVWKQKEIEEQALVSRYIINCFKSLRHREFEEEGPKTIKAGDLLHLKTSFLADTKNIEIENLSSKMLKLLHPTSAVGGMPRTEALDFINENEGFNRQLFAGYLGPVNIKNRTDLFVNIRSARLYKDGAILYAGAGITEDSVPEKEYQETEFKMNVIGKVIESQNNYL